MKKQFTRSFIGAIALMVSVSLSAQTITWEADSIEGVDAVLTEGILMEALNFAGGAVAANYETTVNGVTFTGAVNGADENNAFPDPSGSYFSANSQNVAPSHVDNYKTDDFEDIIPEFDVLMSQFLWNGGVENNTITLSGLTSGTMYKVQLFVGDTRGFSSSAFSEVSGGSDATIFGDAEATNYGGTGLSLVGSFTATSGEVSFTMSKVNNGANEGLSLNGYQLREVFPEGINTAAADEFNVYQIDEALMVQAANVVGDIDVNIYNSLGQNVLSTVAAHNETINVSDMETGIYFVQLRNGNNIETKTVRIY